MTGLVEGRELRDSGQQLALDAADDSWTERAQLRLAELIAEGRPFSADDVVRVAGVPDRPNAVGALFGHASRRRRIVRVGFVQGRRPEQHARLVSVWQRR